MGWGMWGGNLLKHRLKWLLDVEQDKEAVSHKGVCTSFVTQKEHNKEVSYKKLCEKLQTPAQLLKTKEAGWAMWLQRASDAEVAMLSFD